MNRLAFSNNVSLSQKYAWLKKALGASFLFFLIKGMLWLLIIGAAAFKTLL